MIEIILRVTTILVMLFFSFSLNQLSFDLNEKYIVGSNKNLEFEILKSLKNKLKKNILHTATAEEIELLADIISKTNKITELAASKKFFIKKINLIKLKKEILDLIKNYENVHEDINFALLHLRTSYEQIFEELKQ